MVWLFGKRCTDTDMAVSKAFALQEQVKLCELAGHFASPANILGRHECLQ